MSMMFSKGVTCKKKKNNSNHTLSHTSWYNHWSSLSAAHRYGLKHNSNFSLHKTFRIPCIRPCNFIYASSTIVVLDVLSGYQHNLYVRVPMAGRLQRSAQNGNNIEQVLWYTLLFLFLIRSIHAVDVENGAAWSTIEPSNHPMVVPQVQWPHDVIMSNPVCFETDKASRRTSFVLEKSSQYLYKSGSTKKKIGYKEDK